MTIQLSLFPQEINLNPIVVPTPDLDWDKMGGELNEGELAIYQGMPYAVLDWDDKSNSMTRAEFEKQIIQSIRSPEDQHLQDRQQQ